MTGRAKQFIMVSGLALATLSAPGAAAAQSTQDLADRLDAELHIPSLNPRHIRYGGRPEQRISLYARRTAEPLPLVIWVNGRDRLGASQLISMGWLRPFLFENGFALAEVGVRPDGESSAAERARDVAAAMAALFRETAENRLDRDRIVLIGGGLNAHFAALLGTDPRWLRDAGIRFEAVRAVIGFQGVGFDAPRRIAADDYESRYYRRFFGRDPAAQAALSPAGHAALPNAPSFLFYVAENDRKTRAQAEELAAALAPVTPDAQVRSLPLTRRGVAGTYIGAPQHPETARLLAYLRRVLGD